MTPPSLSVTLLTPTEIPSIIRYWTASDPAHLEGMGVDLDKVPSAASLTSMLEGQVALPDAEKQSLATIWWVDGEAIGHCNVNRIEYGQEAYMHLHIWHPSRRRRGVGRQLVALSLPYFFDRLQLQTLWCEPFAHNPAPNATLPMLGFQFENEYVTVPGSLNFEQPVKRWRLTRERWEEMKKAGK